MYICRLLSYAGVVPHCPVLHVDIGRHTRSDVGDAAAAMYDVELHTVVVLHTRSDDTVAATDSYCVVVLHTVTGWQVPPATGLNVWSMMHDVHTRSADSEGGDTCCDPA